MQAGALLVGKRLLTAHHPAHVLAALLGSASVPASAAVLAAASVRSLERQLLLAPLSLAPLSLAPLAFAPLRAALEQSAGHSFLQEALGLSSINFWFAIDTPAGTLKSDAEASDTCGPGDSGQAVAGAASSGTPST